MRLDKLYRLDLVARQSIPERFSLAYELTPKRPREVASGATAAGGLVGLTGSFFYVFEELL